MSYREKGVRAKAGKGRQWSRRSQKEMTQKEKEALGHREKMKRKKMKRSSMRDEKQWRFMDIGQTAASENAMLIRQAEEPTPLIPQPTTVCKKNCQFIDEETRQERTAWFSALAFDDQHATSAVMPPSSVLTSEAINLRAALNAELYQHPKILEVIARRINRQRHDVGDGERTASGDEVAAQQEKARLESEEEWVAASHELIKRVLEFSFVDGANSSRNHRLCGDVVNGHDDEAITEENVLSRERSLLPHTLSLLHADSDGSWAGRQPQERSPSTLTIRPGPPSRSLSDEPVEPSLDSDLAHDRSLLSDNAAALRNSSSASTDTVHNGDTTGSPPPSPFATSSRHDGSTSNHSSSPLPYHEHHHRCHRHHHHHHHQLFPVLQQQNSLLHRVHRLNQEVDAIVEAYHLVVEKAPLRLRSEVARQLEKERSYSHFDEFEIRQQMQSAGGTRTKQSSRTEESESESGGRSGKDEDKDVEIFASQLKSIAMRGRYDYFFTKNVALSTDLEQRINALVSAENSLNLLNQTICLMDDAERHQAYPTWAQMHDAIMTSRVLRLGAEESECRNIVAGSIVFIVPPRRKPLAVSVRIVHSAKDLDDDEDTDGIDDDNPDDNDGDSGGGRERNKERERDLDEGGKEVDPDRHAPPPHANASESHPAAEKSSPRHRTLSSTLADKAQRGNPPLTKQSTTRLSSDDPGVPTNSSSMPALQESAQPSILGVSENETDAQTFTRLVNEVRKTLAQLGPYMSELEREEPLLSSRDDDGGDVLPLLSPLLSSSASLGTTATPQTDHALLPDPNANQQRFETCAQSLMQYLEKKHRLMETQPLFDADDQLDFEDFFAFEARNALILIVPEKFAGKRVVVDFMYPPSPDEMDASRVQVTGDSEASREEEGGEGGENEVLVSKSKGVRRAEGRDNTRRAVLASSSDLDDFLLEQPTCNSGQKSARSNNALLAEHPLDQDGCLDVRNGTNASPFPSGRGRARSSAVVDAEEECGDDDDINGDDDDELMRIDSDHLHKTSSAIFSEGLVSPFYDLGFPKYVTNHEDVLGRSQGQCEDDPLNHNSSICVVDDSSTGDGVVGVVTTSSKSSLRRRSTDLVPPSPSTPHHHLMRSPTLGTDGSDVDGLETSTPKASSRSKSGMRVLSHTNLDATGAASKPMRPKSSGSPSGLSTSGARNAPSRNTSFSSTGFSQSASMNIPSSVSSTPRHSRLSSGSSFEYPEATGDDFRGSSHSLSNWQDQPDHPSQNLSSHAQQQQQQQQQQQLPPPPYRPPQIVTFELGIVSCSAPRQRASEHGSAPMGRAAALSDRLRAMQVTQEGDGAVISSHSSLSDNKGKGGDGTEGSTRTDHGFDYYRNVDTNADDVDDVDDADDADGFVFESIDDPHGDTSDLYVAACNSAASSRRLAAKARERRSLLGSTGRSFSNDLSASAEADDFPQHCIDAFRLFDDWHQAVDIDHSARLRLAQAGKSHARMLRMIRSCFGVINQYVGLRHEVRVELLWKNLQYAHAVFDLPDFHHVLLYLLHVPLVLLTFFCNMVIDAGHRRLKAHEATKDQFFESLDDIMIEIFKAEAKYKVYKKRIDEMRRFVWTSGKQATPTNETPAHATKGSVAFHVGDDDDDDDDEGDIRVAPSTHMTQDDDGEDDAVSVSSQSSSGSEITLGDEDAEHEIGTERGQEGKQIPSLQRTHSRATGANLSHATTRLLTLLQAFRLRFYSQMVEMATVRVRLQEKATRTFEETFDKDSTCTLSEFFTHIVATEWRLARDMIPGFPSHGPSFMARCTTALNKLTAVLQQRLVAAKAVIPLRRAQHHTPGQPLHARLVTSATNAHGNTSTADNERRSSVTATTPPASATAKDQRTHVSRTLFEIRDMLESATKFAREEVEPCSETRDVFCVKSPLQAIQKVLTSCGFVRAKVDAGGSDCPMRYRFPATSLSPEEERDAFEQPAHLTFKESYTDYIFIEIDDNSLCFNQSQVDARRRNIFPQPESAESGETPGTPLSSHSSSFQSRADSRVATPPSSYSEHHRPPTSSEIAQKLAHLTYHVSVLFRKRLSPKQAEKVDEVKRAFKNAVSVLGPIPHQGYLNHFLPVLGTTLAAILSEIAIMLKEMLKRFKQHKLKMDRAIFQPTIEHLFLFLFDCWPLVTDAFPGLKQVAEPGSLALAFIRYLNACARYNVRPGFTFKLKGRQFVQFVSSIDFTMHLSDTAFDRFAQEVDGYLSSLAQRPATRISVDVSGNVVKAPSRLPAGVPRRTRAGARSGMEAKGVSGGGERREDRSSVGMPESKRYRDMVEEKLGKAVDKPPQLKIIEYSQCIPEETTFRFKLVLTEQIASTKIAGRGNFGHVRCGYVVNNTGKRTPTIAVKILDTRHYRVNEFEWGVIDVLRRLSQTSELKAMSEKAAHILAYHGVQRYRESGIIHTNIIMEYMPNGCLKKWLLADGAYYRYWPADIFSALHYLETCRIAHLDVKPSNILITRNFRLKLCDFGCAHLCVKDSPPKIYGTQGYWGPEFYYGLEDRKRVAEYYYKADVWSAGLTLLEMALGDRVGIGHIQDAETRSCYLMNPLVVYPASELLNVVKVVGFEKVADTAEFLNFLSLCFTQNIKDRWPASALWRHKYLREAHAAIDHAQ